MATRHWLLKSDPDTYSFQDLRQSPEQTDCWDGVRNYQARNFLRDDMQEGDGVLFYHSGKKPCVMGTARVVRSGYPDSTAWDPESGHYDPKSSPENPIWYRVDIRFETAFPGPIPLAELRKTPGLEGMLLLKRGMRLSVQPVSEQAFQIITSLSVP